MRTLMITTTVVLLIFGSTTAFSKIARVLTQSELVDTWIGNSADYLYTYRCELGADQKGVLFSTFLDEKPRTFIIEHWIAKNGQITIALDSASRQNYDMVNISAKMEYPGISMYMKGKNWVIPISLRREKPVMSRYELLQEASTAWHETHH